MILPSNLHEGMTVEEAVAGYVADGFPEDRANVMARALLTSPSDQPVT